MNGGSRKSGVGSRERGATALRRCLLLFASCLPLVVAQAQTSHVTVRVAAETRARGERLTLGDVAEVTGSDQEVVTRLRQVALGYAPGVGVVRELTREQTRLALAAAGFGETAVRLEAPAVTLVKRASQQVDAALIREAVERAALADLQAHGATARLVRLDLPPAVEVPEGKVEARASLGSVRDIYAPFTVSVDLWMEGRVVRRLSATAQVEAYAPVLVAARTLAANTRLRADGFALEVRRLNRPLSAYVLDAGRLRGMAVREPIARGEAITRDLLVAEIVVKPGDQVRVIGESVSAPSALQITVSGEARAAGRVGDRVQVRNLQSGNLLQAVVVDEGVVRVRF
jgi:flagellar basal body P-ring formation protein FlgA